MRAPATTPSIPTSLWQSAAGSIVLHARWPVRLGLAAFAALLAWNFVDYLATAIQAIAYPFELDYGEGIVWQQMILLLAGHGYGRIDGLPAIVFHYPPLYHAAVGYLSAWTGMDQLSTGRLLSVGSTLVMAGFVGAVVAELSPANAGRPAARTAALLTALIVLGLLPVQLWSYLMRVDMISLACTFAGFYFGLRALRQPGAIHIAAILFVAAVYGKQTALAAPVAVFGVLLFLRPRTALAGIATGAGLGLAVLTPLMWHTDGGFLRHILSYNINRVRWAGLMDIVAMVHYHYPYIFALLFSIFVWLRRLPVGFFTEGGALGLRRRLLASDADAAYVMALAYFLVATPMLALVLKSGASVNYFIEWGCLVAIFAGLAVVDAAALALNRPPADKAHVLLIPLIALLAFQAYLLLNHAGNRLAGYAYRRAEMVQLVELVKAAPKPIVSDDMVVLLRAGKSVVLEPSIYAELTGTGAWSERPFIEKIRAHDFAFLIADGKAGEEVYDSRYSRTASQEILKEYPVVRSLAGYRLQFPAGPLPAYAAHLR